MSACWNPQQREWLQALGHDVLVLASAGGAPDAAAIATGMPGAAAAAQPPGPAAGIAAGDSLLQRALWRAAGGRDPADLAWLPDPATLRGNAAAKRALWPRLRALRQAPRKA